MMNLTRDIRPLTDFKRDTARLRRELRHSGRPLVLTVNGKASLVVHDAASYQKLLERLERAEAIQGIRRGLESFKKGKGRPLTDVDTRIRRKYGLPR